jgi:hypothetical protein
MGVFWSAVGYFTARFAYSLQEKQQVDQTEDKQYSFSNTFYVCSYSLIIVGTIVAILQVILFVPLMEYISNLFSSDFDADIRLAYLLSSDEGGLSGIIKLLAFAPLSIYLMSFGLLNFLHLDIADMQKLRRLNKMALLGTTIKVFFSLDHLTIMAVLMANIFTGIQKGYIKHIKFFISLTPIFLLANFLSSKRLEGFGIVDFVLLYFKLGLVNFQLMIETVSGYTYGFSSIFAPLYFIFKFFGLSLPDFATSYYAWEWNPAQYLTSYAFQDFGYFYFILFYFIGFTIYFVDLKTLKRKNIYSSAIYFLVLSGIISFLLVPAMRGMEFWFAFIVPLFLLNRFTKSSTVKHAKVL